MKKIMAAVMTTVILLGAQAFAASGYMGGSSDQGSSSSQNWGSGQGSGGAYPGQGTGSGPSMGGSMDQGMPGMQQADPATVFCRGEASRLNVPETAQPMFIDKCRREYSNRLGGSAGQPGTTQQGGSMGGGSGMENNPAGNMQGYPRQ